jgi:hypothetical protein
VRFWRRPDSQRLSLWKVIERKIDDISRMNRRQVPIMRGQVRYDSRGWLEDNRDLYTFDGRRIHFRDGRAMYAMSGGVFSPPIGIPDPAFGTDTPVMPTLPSPWVSNQVGFFYVKTGGTNNSPSTGSGFPGNPRGNIPNPIPAGAVVVMDNTSTFTMPTNVAAAGTSGSPCFLVGSSLSTSNRAVMDPNGDAGFTGTYLIVEFISFRPVSGGSLFVGLSAAMDHLALRHCAISGTTSQPTHAAIQMASYLGSFNISNIVIYDLQASVINDWTLTTSDLDAHGIKVDNSATTQNVWILDSTFDQICGDGFQIGPQDFDTNCHHIYCGRNAASRTRQAGGWAKGAHHIIFSQNTFSLNGVPGVGGPGHGTGCQTGARDFWLLYNHIYSTTGQAGINFLDRGAFTTDPQELYAVGNVVHDGDTSRGEGLVGLRMRSPMQQVFVNNTVVNWSVGAHKTISGTQAHRLRNNIIDNVSSFHYQDNGSADGVTFRNNLFGLGAQNFRVSYNGTTHTSLASFASAAGAAASGNVNADPTYVDSSNSTIANRNFALVSGSRGINEGDATEDPVYALFQTTFGLDIRRDFNGVVRPQSTIWDIGAFELSTGVDTTPPTISIANPTGPVFFTNLNPLTILSGTSADDVAVTSVTWANDRGGSGTATGTTAWTVPSITLQTGSNVITATARDAAGNTASASVTVVLDQIAPLISIDTPTSSPNFSTTTTPLPTLSGTSSDANGIAAVSWTNDRGGSGIATGTTSWSAAAIVLQAGPNILTATALDNAGNTASDTLTVTYNPPVSSVTIRPFMS